jgi:hypothetical protein
MGHFSVIRQNIYYDTKAGHFKIIAPKNKITKSFSTKFHILSNSKRRPFEVKAERPDWFPKSFLKKQ